MTLETLGMHHGKEKKGDVIEDNLEAAMNAIRNMVEEKRWDFALTPLSDFNATTDDLLRAFVIWAKVNNDNNKKSSSDDEKKEKYNVSKAFRRMESYVTWMDKNCKDLNLQGGTMKTVAEAWKMKITRDKDGRMVWWMDFGAVDLHQIKKDIPHDDTLRYFVWISHFMMFDKSVQDQGMMLVEAIGNIGLIETMTVLPMDLGTSITRSKIYIYLLQRKYDILHTHKLCYSILVFFIYSHKT